MINLRWAAVPLIVAMIGLVVACGGDSDDSTGSTGSTDAQATGGTGASGATGSGSASGASGSSGSSSTQLTALGLDPASGTINVSQVTANLEEISSFRFDFNLKMDLGLSEMDSLDAEGEDAFAALLLALFSDIEAEGTYVAPDRSSLSMKIFGMEFETITIGEESWSNDGTGWSLDEPGEGFESEFSLPFDMTSPGELASDFFPEEELRGAKTSQETVNGFETTRYSFDKESLQALAEAAGEETGMEDLSDMDEMTLDVWVTSDGIPVKMKVVASGESEGSDVSIDLEFNIKDLNDPSISIQRPI